jgi:nuclease HARBI1
MTEISLKQIICQTGNLPLYIYGDGAYRACRFVMGPYLGGQELPQEKRDVNYAMSSVRIAVENIFSQIAKLWAFTSWRGSLRAGSSPITAYLSVAVLLTNCITCLRGGNLISRRFGIAPPIIEEYLFYSREVSSEGDSDMSKLNIALDL